MRMKGVKEKKKQMERKSAGDTEIVLKGAETWAPEQGITRAPRTHSAVL